VIIVNMKWKKYVNAILAIPILIIFILAIIYFFSKSSEPQTEPNLTDETSTTQPQPRAKRTLSGTFTILGSSTVTVGNMYYVYYGSKRKRDKVIVKVIGGPYKNLLWLNENLPAIQIKKPKTIIYACAPGVGKRNKIKFMNMGGEPITVQIRIIPYRA